MLVTSIGQLQGNNQLKKNNWLMKQADEMLAETSVMVCDLRTG